MNFQDTIYPTPTPFGLPAARNPAHSAGSSHVTFLASVCTLSIQACQPDLSPPNLHHRNKSPRPVSSAARAIRPHGLRPPQSPRAIILVLPRLAYEAAYGSDPQLVAVVQKWLSYLAPGSTVLECGCGTGKPIACTIADKGYRYHGIDIADGMVDICRSRVPDGTYEVVSMLDYRPSEPYAGIVASLSHFELSPEEQYEMGRKWFEWLEPEGYLLVSTIAGEEFGANARSFDEERECASGVEATFLGTGILINVFTRKGWRMLLEAAGLEIVHTQSDVFVPKGDSPDEPRFYIIARKLGGA